MTLEYLAGSQDVVGSNPKFSMAEGLSDEIIKWRSLEVLEKLSASPNAKLIITDGNAPVLINEDSK